MKNAKRLLCALLSVLTLFTLLCGCGKKAEEMSSDGDLPYVTLKCYIIGDMPAQSETVLENLNSMLKEKINATLDIIEIPWSDYKKKYSLILSSGENIDLIYTSNWCYFYTEARKGAFMALDEDMISKYAPNTMANVPSEAWDYVKIDGKISMLPQINATLTSKAIVYREDLRKKYNVPEINSIETLEQYYEAIKENEEGMFPLNATLSNIENLFFAYMWEREAYKPVYLTDALVASADDSSGDLKPIYETESYKEWAEIAQRWNEKGYWSKNILSNKTSADNAFLNGTSASTVCQLSSTLYSQSKMYTMHPDWEMGTYLLFHDDKSTISSYTNNGMAIPATSKNPERALMAYDLLAWDKDFYMAHNYGIEGVTYETTEDGYVTTLKDADPNNSYKFGGLGLQMGMNNLKFNCEDPSSAQDLYVKYMLDADSAEKYGLEVKATVVPYDVTDISNELTALNNTYKNYSNLLITGSGTDSVDEQLKLFKKSAETAGVEKICEELNKQYKAFAKNS